jgi:hypothetical protein
MSNPSAPVRLAELTAQPGASNANGNGVGQVRFGAVGPTSAVIYAMSTNNGIQAFQLTGVPEPATWAMLAAGLAAMAVGRSRPRG